MEKGHSKPKVYFENLDGLRFFAFFAVFLAHSFYSEVDFIRKDEFYLFLKMIIKKGTLGVNFFFVLSGFLITYLLLEEKQKKGSIHLKNFYLRRVLRIWPLFYLIVFVGFVVIPLFINFVFKEVSYTENAHLIYYLFFINNFDTAPSSAVLGILWSLAIEEQFYLVWPLLFRFVPQKHYLKIFWGVLLMSLLFRFFISNNGTHTLAAISDMAMGGLCAYLVFENFPILTYIQKMPKWIIILLYIIGFSIIFSGSFWVKLHSFFPPLERLIYSFFFAFIILEQNYAQHSVIKMSSFSKISYWGTYTYGLYCLHFVAIYIVSRLFRTLVEPSFWHTYFTETICSFLLSILAAYLSYHLYEQPFLKLKQKFA